MNTGASSSSFNSNCSAVNRLSKVKITKEGEAASINYLTNAAGQQVFKSEPKPDQYLPSATELGTGFIAWLKMNFGWLYAQAQTDASLGSAYTYADGQLPSWAVLGEYDNGSASGAGRTEYIWLPTEDGGAVPVGMFRNSKFFAIHSDHLGTPRLMTDSLNKPVWQWPYSAFGNNKPTGILTPTATAAGEFTNQPVLLATQNPAATLDLRFPGQMADVETGLFYNYFRSYQPTQGRYTQGDPIGLGGGLNRFGYANQNALSYSDPLGLYTEVIRWANSPGFTGSWGKISGNIKGQNFSFGPSGWDTRYPTAQQYADRQKSPDIDREGRGIILQLSPLEEAKLASCLQKANNYHGMNNNCGNPWRQCLDELGITHSGNRPAVLPEDVMKIIGSSKRAAGNTSYSGKRPLY